MPQKLGFKTVDSEPPLKTYLRAETVGVMCGSGHEDCLQKAADALADWKTKTDADPNAANPVDLNLRSKVGNSNIIRRPIELILSILLISGLR